MVGHIIQDTGSREGPMRKGIDPAEQAHKATFPLGLPNQSDERSRPFQTHPDLPLRDF